MDTPEAPFDEIRETLKKAAAALREAAIPFVLAGGLASWARGGPETDELIERSDEREVDAVRMRVITATDLLVTKLLALKEHEVDYDSVLEVARSLREQIDWERLREDTAHSPYARAFFTLAEGLGLSANG